MKTFAHLNNLAKLGAVLDYGNSAPTILLIDQSYSDQIERRQRCQLHLHRNRHLPNPRRQ